VPRGDVLYYLIGRRRVSDLCLICASPKSYDEPEILPSSSPPVCHKGAEAGNVLKKDFANSALSSLENGTILFGQLVNKIVAVRAFSGKVY
jgi:hypothetical protein